MNLGDWWAIADDVDAAFNAAADAAFARARVLAAETTPMGCRRHLTDGCICPTCVPRRSA